jgi:hypothetical protein
MRKSKFKEVLNSEVEEPGSQLSQPLYLTVGQNVDTAVFYRTVT